MNYYIYGDAAKSQQIKAAFEKSWYNTGNLGFTSSQLYYTIDGKVELMYTKALQNIIKTHPDYKELELPTVSKFKVGDWVVFNNSHNSIYQISEIKDSYYNYILTHTHGGSMPLSFSQEELIRPWSIADAKDGDVLATGNIICIFKKLDKDGYYIISPCIYTVKDGLEVIDDEDNTIGSYGFKPATKEDRELLFRKMQEAGYEWDKNKKELRKIKPHYDIDNFKPKQWVLVRDDDEWEWALTRFSHLSNGSVSLFVCINGASFQQCIPFEGNEHLLGTTDMCDERFINW